jgi:hypothetical protein
MTKILTLVELETPAWEVASPMGPDVTWRFAEPTEYLPAEFDAIPSIASVRYDAATISLGENLGQRASLTVTFRDHKHVMGSESFDSGTMWGKFRARYGQKLRGRPIRLIRGALGQELADMETRHFFVESTDGPTPDGIYTITAKDLLKFADDDRAQAPLLSNGRLAGSIDDDDAAAVLSPTGIGDLEYPASGHICLGGKEIVAFTRSGDDVTITRGQLGTLAQSHSAGDRAQLVLNYDGDDVADIISDLLTNYAGIDSDYIPLSEWQAETAANLGGILYARAITEPTAVGKLVSELVEQAALALWWDERARIVRLQVLREIATDADVFDEGVILEGSLKVKDQPGKRISQIWTYYGQRNPADRGDAEDNYRSCHKSVVPAELEYGSAMIRKVVGKWIATINAAERLNQIQLSRFRDPPRKLSFDLFHDALISAGSGYRLRWRQNQDVDGNIVEEGAPIQVTRVSVEPGVVHIEAEEMLASGMIVLTNTVFLTTTGGVLNWTVPADWNDDDNAIHCIGGGGRGHTNGRGAGAGAYSGITNLDLTPSASIQYRVGDGGTSSSPSGGDTWFNGANLASSSVGAKGGGSGASGGQGGQAAQGIGTVKFSGGPGGSNSEDTGAGAGGAAGPHGNGAAGRSGSSGTELGSGGGAADGGDPGGFPNGGHNRFGFGAGTVSSPNGQEGAGGASSGDGGAGEPLWTQTIAPIISAGPGGGGGGSAEGSRAGRGGLYGGGGGGADPDQSDPGPGNGAQGIVVITWRPAA